MIICMSVHTRNTVISDHEDIILHLPNGSNSDQFKFASAMARVRTNLSNSYQVRKTYPHAKNAKAKAMPVAKAKAVARKEPKAKPVAKKEPKKELSHAR